MTLTSQSASCQLSRRVQQQLLPSAIRQLWQLLEAADMYLLSGLVNFSTQKLSDHLRNSEDERELVTMVKQARRLPIFEEVRLNL